MDFVIIYSKDHQRKFNKNFLNSLSNNLNFVQKKKEKKKKKRKVKIRAVPTI